MLIRRVSDCGIEDCIHYIIFKGTLTKLHEIYSYFSAPVLNNNLVFANGKILPLFMNQTITELQPTRHHIQIYHVIEYQESDWDDLHLP